MTLALLRARQRVMDICRDALALAPDTYPPDLPPQKGPLAPGRAMPEVSDWYRFEHQTWPMGEEVRQTFQKWPRLKRDPAATESVMEVVECAALRRGRQSFVMALGFTAAAHLAPRVARFLNDPDIDGQVIDTLLRMKASGFSEDVKPSLTAQHTWIRNLAKKYVSRYSPSA